MEHLKWIVGTCAGFGYSPVLPGTCGALWGIVIFLPIGLWLVEPWQSIAVVGAFLVVCAITIQMSNWAEVRFCEKDSGKFVTDEVAGFLLTVVLFRVPSVAFTVLWAFPMTRAIDIIKVPPAKRLEKLPGGIGVLADDLLGSIYAAGVLHVICWLAPDWFGIGG